MTAEATAPPTPAVNGADIPTIVARLRKTFATGRTRDVAWRKRQLEGLHRLLSEDGSRLLALARADTRQGLARVTLERVFDPPLAAVEESV